jgi:NAD(P)-dependent dehydrogenase (short-subunit alcohol dehydrogenase family)
MVRGLVARGWVVGGCGRVSGRVEGLAGELGEPHRVLCCDVADAAAVERFGAEVMAAHGPPDLLVNNAAVINGNARMWEVGVEEFSRLIDVNVKGIHHVCRAFVPAMIRAGRGVIVNVSSGWGRSTSPEVAPYCASKWAVEGLTRALAQELPPGLAAIPLNPGIIDTEMLRSCWGAEAGSFPDPEEWAAVAVPFLEQLGPRENGRPLTVAGGCG